MLIHTNPLGTLLPTQGIGPITAGLMPCAQLAGIPGFGRCDPGQDVASVRPNFAYEPSDVPYTAWPSAPISSRRVEDLPVQTLVVGTDGTAPVLERVRTVLTIAFPHRDSAATIAERRADTEGARLLKGYEQLADVVIVVSLCIAGCALATSVIGGLNERKRPFSLLRLTGVRLATLRRAVVLESAVPLLVNVVVAIGAGFLAAELFLESQLGYTLRPPGAGYAVTVLAGLAVSLGVIAATLPLLRRITGPETARNE
jgi:predicted lysophospholipase L1 biosynthesis ABC-type transport system permease subunit